MSEALAPMMRLLEAHGAPVTEHVAADVCGDFGVPDVSLGLQRLGVESRVVRFNPGELPLVPGDSLVWIDKEPPAFLRRRGRDIELTLADGHVRRVTKREVARASGRAICVVPRAADAGASYARRVHALLRADSDCTRAIALAGAAALAASALGLALTAVLRFGIDAPLSERSPNTLRTVAVAVVAIAAHAAWSGWARRRACLFLESKVADAGADALVRHLFALPFRRLHGIEVGRVLELTRVAQASAGSLAKLALSALDGVVAVGYFVMLVMLDGLSAALVAAGAAFIALTALALAPRARAVRERRAAASRAQRQMLYETVAGIETVKAEAVEDRMVIRYVRRLVEFLRLHVHEQSDAALQSLAMSSVERIVYGSILVIVATRAISGFARIGELLAALQASASFFALATTFGKLPTGVAAFRAETKLLDDVFAEDVEPTGSRSTAPARVGEAIVLHDVWFRYGPESAWIIRSLDLVVEYGAKVVLRWPSGAGKSTLLRLLAGLLRPERGDVLVFGGDAALRRQQVAYVPQEAGLLPASVLENLRVLSGGAPVERILAAATATGLDELVSGWPMRYDTLVSIGSSNVSSGQRQLVLFTAALASEAPVLLLDEAFSHMDAAMRRRLDGLDLLKDRTVVAVVHAD